jgi:SAM-dependent methyltransferase
MTDGKSKTWEEHWAEGHIPWDAGRASPSLEKYVVEHPAPQGARALVPGCGSGYDVFRLAHAGYETVGVDLAPSAHGRFSALRTESGLSDSRATLITSDFFALTPDEVGGSFDLIWDYTFYCAIELDQRNAWRDQMARLLSPDGTLVMLLFPVVPGAPEDQGPPYPLSPTKVIEQLAPSFENLLLEKATASHPGREEKEWLSVWRKRHAPPTRT